MISSRSPSHMIRRRSSSGMVVPVINLVANSGFEVDTTGWTPVGSNTIARSADQAKFGGFSGKATYQNNNILVRYGITLAPGQYRFSVWGYIPTTYDGTAISASSTDFAGAVGTTIVAFNLALRDQWQQVSYLLNVMASDLSGNLDIREFGSAPTAGRFVYIDGAQIVAL